MNVRPLFGGVKKLWVIKDAAVSLYRANPRVANAFTGCVTFSLGDALAQRLEAKRTGNDAKFDVWRSVQLGVLGIAMNGFFLHHWYHGLDRIVGSSMTSRVGVITKVIADQLIYAPFAIVSFFYFTSARKATSVADANQSFLRKMDSNFMSTFLADCAVWPASNFVNFRYVNLAYRPSFTALVQLLWQTYLSTTSASSNATARAEGSTAAAEGTSDMF
jgi:hypothetical protein